MRTKWAIGCNWGKQFTENLKSGMTYYVFTLAVSLLSWSAGQWTSVDFKDKTQSSRRRQRHCNSCGQTKDEDSNRERSKVIFCLQTKKRSTDERYKGVNKAGIKVKNSKNRPWINCLICLVIQRMDERE